MTATGRRQPGIVPVRDTFTRAWKKLPRAAARVSWTDSQPASRVRVYVLIGLSRLNSPFYPPINPLPGTENSEKWFRIVIRFLLTRRDEPRAYIFQPRVRELLTFANTAPAWISAGCINLPPAAFEWIAGGRSRFLVCAKMGSVIHGVIHKYLTRRQRAALVLYQSTHMRARSRVPWLRAFDFYSCGFRNTPDASTSERNVVLFQRRSWSSKRIRRNFCRLVKTFYNPFLFAPENWMQFEF